MQKLSIILSVLVLSASAYSCPKMSNANPQDLTVVTEYATRLAQVGDDDVYNKTLAKCFDSNIEALSWDQTAFMMTKLRRNDYGGRKSGISIQKNMAEAYLENHFDLTFADVAVEISKKMEYVSEANKMLHEYFKKALERNMIGYDQLMVVLKGIGNTNNDTERYSQSKTQDRILRAYFKKKVSEMTIAQLIEVAPIGFRYYGEANDYFEKYFKAHVVNLSWEETMTLMNALYNTNTNDRHDKARTKERMTLLWNEIHN